MTETSFSRNSALAPSMPPLCVLKFSGFLNMYRARLYFGGTRSNTYIRFSRSQLHLQSRMHILTAGLLTDFMHNKKRKCGFQAGVDLAYLVIRFFQLYNIRRCTVDCVGRHASRDGFFETLFEQEDIADSPGHEADELSASEEPAVADSIAGFFCEEDALITPIQVSELSPIAHNGTRRKGRRRI